jgi:hypothetical protein
MAKLITQVKKFSEPMFVVFVFSKLLVGIGIGIIFAQALAPLGWPILAVGVILSLFCLTLALKKA